MSLAQKSEESDIIRRMAHVAIYHSSPLFLPPGRGFQAQENLPR
jgi:hypothetical protein